MMEIFNLKEVELSFENMEYCRFDASGIEFTCLSEYDYLINGDKVYLLHMELPTDEKYIIKPEAGDNFYSKNPLGHLNKWDDVDGVKFYYKDGSVSKLDPYWGNFNVDEINLYQHGKYEVDTNSKLTGKFILELYIRRLSNDLQEIVDKRRNIRDFIYDELWAFNPMRFEGFGKIKPCNVYIDDANALTNYMYYNKETNLDKFKQILYDSEKSQWSKEFVDMDSHAEKLNQAAEYIYRRLTEEK